MYYNYNAPSYHDSYSKEPRSKFTGTVNLNGFYSDPDGLLYDDEVGTLEDGLEHFYKATGVCAYLPSGVAPVCAPSGTLAETG